MWRSEKVALLEHRPEYGGMHVVGVTATRHCGCKAQLGMRLDKQETTFGASACKQHEVYVARAMDVFKHMPPQDTPVFELWETLLERELQAVPA